VSGNNVHRREPTVFHITHWKAGSQWVHRILHRLAFHRLVLPNQNQTQFFDEPIADGRIYPTVYVTKEQFEAVAVPADHRRFVIIRDLRDTLVSLYYSAKVSHVTPDVDQEEFFETRKRLNRLSHEQGMLAMLRDFEFVARIQRSWVASGEPLVYYEDMLEDDLGAFRHVFLERCALDVTHQQLEEAVIANRFEQLTGRRRGQENIAAHERKGIAGDWRNHFTDRIKRVFKDQYGDELVAAGYERDFNW
jgi:hypothetical protein